MIIKALRAARVNTDRQKTRLKRTLEKSAKCSQEKMNMLNKEEYMTFWTRFDTVYSELDPHKGRNLIVLIFFLTSHIQLARLPKSSVSDIFKRVVVDFMARLENFIPKPLNFMTNTI